MRVAFLFLVASTSAFEASDMTKDASTNRHSHSPVAKPKTAENEDAKPKEENKTEKDEVQEAAQCTPLPTLPPHSPLATLTIPSPPLRLTC